ncbi:MAG: GldG family protein [Cyanophyceae cyanobacterium]
MTKARYLNFLYIPGLMLLTAGLVIRVVAGSWSPAAIGLLTSGVVILVLWLGVIAVFRSSFWGKRSTQAGTNAVIATSAVLLILGLLNFLAVRYAERIDLTENRLFTLSPQSQEIVQNLPQPLKVWVFTPTPSAADRELLENYRRWSDRFEFEVVDPQVNIALAERFQVQSLGDVYLEYGDKNQLVQTLNPAERLSEVRLTNAIAQIQRDRTIPVYFLQGHGEPTLDATEGGLSQAVTSLEERGYSVEALNLAEREDVPQDAAAIVIAGPQRELFEGEVTALREYLSDGGSLLLMLDPQTETGLEPLLDDWGIELDERVVIDASGTGNLIGYGPATTLITNYGNHPVTEDFTNGISVYPLARPIGTVETEGVQAVSLLITNEQTWAESNLEEEVEFNPTQDVEGPFDLGVALTKSASEEAQSQASLEDDEALDSTNSAEELADESSSSEEATEQRLVAIGNAAFVTNGWFEQQINGDVFLNSVDWLAGDDEQTLSIRPKSPENRRINLTALQAGVIGWLALLIVPLGGLIAAAIAWWRRR